MIYLLHGNDEYQLNKRLKELILPDSTKMNTIIYGDSFDLPKIIQEAKTLPFMADQKFIILKGFLSTKDKIKIKGLEEQLTNIPEFCTFILYEESIDNRLGIVKQIDKVGKIQNFDQLKPFEMANWITKSVSSKGGTISLKTANKFASMISNDLINAENEIDKVLNYDKNISDDALDLLIVPDFNDSIFALTDAISEGKKDVSVRLIEKFIDNGDNESYLLAMISKQIRNLILIKDLLIKQKSENEIVTLTGLHPFVVKKSINYSRKVSMDNLLEIHNKLIETDLSLKTSSIEPKILLTKLLS